MTATIDDRLKTLGIELPKAAAPAANYVPSLITGNFLYISGQLPMEDGKIAVTGKLGGGVDLAEGERAARLCAINILAQAKAALGDLGRIRQCLKLQGFVNAAPDFGDHPAVINGASNLIADILGDAGKHTRIAVGCASLPFNVAVEVDALFAVAEAT